MFSGLGDFGVKFRVLAFLMVLVVGLSVATGLFLSANASAVDHGTQTQQQSTNPSVAPKLTPPSGAPMLTPPSLNTCWLASYAGNNTWTWTQIKCGGPFVPSTGNQIMKNATFVSP